MQSNSYADGDRSVGRPILDRSCTPPRATGGALRRMGRAVVATGCALVLAPIQAQGTLTEAEPSAVSYEFGRGLRLGDSGFTIGGYITGEFQRQSRAPSQFRSSHASLFIWWEGLDHLKAFAEIDHENVLARYRDPAIDDGRSERRYSLERLHLDWTFNDALTVRLGKFLTPIGRWNLVHADPLVWTTSRPLLTQTAYPHNATGLMASGQLGLGRQPLRYWIYASNGTEWAADPRQDPFATVRGGRAVLPLGSDWQVGLSYAHYQQRGSRGEPRTLAGLDLLWAASGYEVTVEWLQTSADRPGPPPQGARPPEPDNSRLRLPPRAVPTRGGYLQGVIPMPLVADLYGVARLEWVRDTGADAASRQATVGLAWRPNAGLSVKLEWQANHGPGATSPEGLTASVSVLF